MIASGGNTTTAVVGGSGSIGRYLTGELLAAGITVRILDLAPPPDTTDAEWIYCDTRDREVLVRALRGVDTVFNLAAAHGLEVHSTETYWSVNVEGAQALCDAADACSVHRLVFTSSAAVYGHIDSPNEDTACAPNGEYAASKLAAEDVYRSWVRESDERCLAIVRPAVVFGPGTGGAGNRLIRRVAEPDFALVGGARNRKSLAFVENLAAFLAFVAARSEGRQLYNYCDTPDLSLAEIVSLVRGALDLPPARERSHLHVYTAAARASVVRRLVGSAAPGLRAVRRSVRRMSRELLFDAGRAHGSGFTQPVDVKAAIERTARAELSWITLVERSRGRLAVDA